MAKAKDNKAKATAKLATTPKKVDFSSLSDKELTKQIDQLRKELVELKRGNIVGEVQNVRAYNARRKQLARALTVRNQVTITEVK